MELTTNKVIKQPSDVATGNTITINQPSGKITTAALTNGTAVAVDITLTNSFIIDATTKVFASVTYGGASYVAITNTTVSAGQVIFSLRNIGGSVALNAAATIDFLVVQKTTN